MARKLIKDPIVRLQGLVIFGVMIPFFVPGITSHQLWGWALLYSEIPLLLVTMLAFQYQLSRIEDPAERRFWNLWTLSIGAWLVKTLIAIGLDLADGLGPTSELALNFGFFVFYLLAAMALESRPNLPSGRQAETLRAIERSGTLIFFSGLLLYFAVIPAVFDPYSYTTSSLLLYVALDCYLVIRLAGFMRNTVDARWRRIYGWLLTTCCLWLVTDSAEMLSWSLELSWIKNVSHIDLIWLLPWGTLVLAARVREMPVRAGSRQRQPTGFPLGPLVVYTVSFPILHFSLNQLGLDGEEMAPLRGGLALVLMIVMATLVVTHQELLRVENRRLERERLESQRQIEHLAFRDALTGLPNRRLLADRVERGMRRARRFQRLLGVLLLDIDDFKAVNDTHGHDVGDEVLRQLAKRLEGCVRGGDTVARLGGDEFVAVVEGLRSSEDSQQVLELIHGSLSSPYQIGDLSLSLGCTIGAAVFPDEGETFDDLLKQADIAMYRGKDELRRRAAGPRVVE